MTAAARPAASEPSLPASVDEASASELRVALPDLRQRGPLGRFFAGVLLVVRGQRLALGHPSLRRLSLGVMALNLFLYAGPVATGSLLLFFLNDVVHERARAHAQANWVVAATDGSLELFVALLWGLGWLASLFSSVLVSRLLSGFLLDSLSERTEALYFQRPARRLAWARSLWRSVKEVFVQLLLLAVHLPVLVVLFFVGRIHEVGPVVAGVLGWAWTSLWLALSFTTSIAQRHGLGARERLRLALSEKALCFGLGGLVALVPALLLPVLLPGLICGGTKAFLALAAHGSVPSDLDEAARARLLAPRPEGEEGDR